jgi:hypothetical protein
MTTIFPLISERNSKTIVLRKVSVQLKWLPEILKIFSLVLFQSSPYEA